MSAVKTAKATGSGLRLTNKFRMPWGYVIAGILAVYAVGPLLIFLSNSLKSSTEIASNPLGLPTAWNWENFAVAWTQARMGQGLANSALIAIATAVGVAVIASLAAYALTRLDLPFKGGWILWLLVSTSVPIQLFLVPLVSWWSMLGLYNSKFGLIVIYWAVFSPFATMLVRSFMIGIPTEFIEAARLDGASELHIFWRVVMPSVWPGVLTAALVAGLQAYNEFMLAVTFLQKRVDLPVSVSMYSFQQGFTVDWALVSAAGVIMALPVVIIFVLLQKRFIEGYASGGLAN